MIRAEIIPCLPTLIKGYNRPMIRSWNFLAWMILLATAILTAAQFPAYPYFLDSFYHLTVIQGFRDAGGPVLHAFWEAAPEGRPHLYPPLFHLLFYPLSRLGASPLFLARFWSWASFPGFLLVAWTVLRQVATPRRACLTLISLATPYSFYLSTVNYLPATLVLAVGLGLMLALQKQRPLAGGILLALAFYLHAGFPWLLVLSLLLYGLFDPPSQKTVFLILAIGLVGGAPWLLHLFGQIGQIHFQPRGEEKFFECPILSILLGIAGLKLAWSRGGISRFWVALAIGFLPMLGAYRYRFFSAEGLFPWLLLSGLTLDHLFEKYGQRLGGAWVGLTALVILAPTLYSAGDGLHLAWADTTPSILAGRTPPIPRATALSLFRKKLIDELPEQVKIQTSPDDLVYCNLPYIGGMLNIFTGRATTNEMLREMAERPMDDQVGPAKLIVWLKNPDGRPSDEGLFRRIVSRHHLEPVAESDLAYFLRNPSGTGQRRVAPSVMPGWLACGIILLAVGVVVWDLKRRI